MKARFITPYYGVKGYRVLTLPSVAAEFEQYCDVEINDQNVEAVNYSDVDFAGISVFIYNIPFAAKIAKAKPIQINLFALHVHPFTSQSFNLDPRRASGVSAQLPAGPDDPMAGTFAPVFVMQREMPDPARGDPIAQPLGQIAAGRHPPRRHLGEQIS